MKYIRFLLCAALIIFTFCMFGCTTVLIDDDPDSVIKDIDIVALSQELLSTLEIGDSVEEVDDFVITALYDIDPKNVRDSIVFMSTGAKADEIAIFQVVTPDNASHLNTIFEERKTDQINIFKDYAPEEVTKLNSSVIYSNDQYAVFCVSPDNERAREIIESYF